MSDKTNEATMTIPHRIRADHRVMSVSGLMLSRPQNSDTGIVVIDGHLDVMDVLSEQFRISSDGVYLPKTRETRLVREKVVTLMLPEAALRRFIAGILQEERRR